MSAGAISTGASLQQQASLQVLEHSSTDAQRKHSSRWVMCDSCGFWRRVSKQVHEQAQHHDKWWVLTSPSEARTFVSRQITEAIVSLGDFHNAGTAIRIQMQSTTVALCHKRCQVKPLMRKLHWAVKRYATSLTPSQSITASRQQQHAAGRAGQGWEAPEAETCCMAANL